MIVLLKVEQEEEALNNVLPRVRCYFHFLSASTASESKAKPPDQGRIREPNSRQMKDSYKHKTKDCGKYISLFGNLLENTTLFFFLMLLKNIYCFTVLYVLLDSFGDCEKTWETVHFVFTTAPA